MDLLVKWRSDIARGKVRVMFVDECHLLWGDVSGYGWSRRNQRVDIAVKSTKERQTDYGALDYLSKRFVVREYSAGNEDNTVAFLEYLQSLYDQSTRLIIVWDGASYHRSAAIRDFLARTNATLAPPEWKVTCIRLARRACRNYFRHFLLFAPNAHEQNPVEDVWLQAKQFVRKFARLCRHFRSVKLLFKLFTHYQIFDFAKAFMYGYCSSPV